MSFTSRYVKVRHEFYLRLGFQISIEILRITFKKPCVYKPVFTCNELISWSYTTETPEIKFGCGV